VSNLEHAAPGGSRGVRRRSGQQGQALLEFTMIFVFIMFLLAGVADVGGLLDIHIAGIYAARQGARTGAVLGNGSTSLGPCLSPCTAPDCAIVGAVHSVLVNQPNLTVTQITIYKAGANGLSTGQAQYFIGTADCLNGNIVDATDGSATSPLPGSNWDPADRIVAPYCADSLGVKIDYTYQFQFNLFGVTFPTSDYAVFPINPDPSKRC
jgi:hypothetical protein